MMTLTLEPQKLPLHLDEHGVVRVAGSRIPLERIVWDFNNSATPAEIVRDFPTLNLADVYAIVGYYVRHRSEVDAYIEEGERIAEAIRQTIEADPGHQEFHQRMVALLKHLTTPAA